MYSRNFSTDIGGTTVRLNSNYGAGRGKAEKEKIPVKSFTDNFAYERFNKMDMNKTYEDRSQLPDKVKENEIVKESPDPEESSCTENAYSEYKAVKADEKYNEIGILTRLKNTFDSDTLLIILAVIMLLFSDNATNDKLTPLALLAILFL